MGEFHTPSFKSNYTTFLKRYKYVSYTTCQPALYNKGQTLAVCIKLYNMPWLGSGITEQLTHDKFLPISYFDLKGPEIQKESIVWKPLL